MHCSAGSDDGARRLWRTSDATHVDLRGLDPPEPMTELLRLIDSGSADAVIIGHFDREPIYLYPELEDRSWSHEIIESSCGGPDCDADVRLRMVRWGR